MPIYPGLVIDFASTHRSKSSPDEAERERGVAQAGAAAMGLQRDLRGVLAVDVRIGAVTNISDCATLWRSRVVRHDAARAALPNSARRRRATADSSRLCSITGL
jgi:hypothetical protein